MITGHDKSKNEAGQLTLLSIIVETSKNEMVKCPSNCSLKIQQKQIVSDFLKQASSSLFYQLF